MDNIFVLLIIVAFSLMVVGRANQELREEDDENIEKDKNTKE